MTSDIRQGWKVFTRDWRSPIQGGAPVCNGTFPFTLPTVTLDMSDRECGAGWNYTATIAEALTIGGMWPDGYPSRVVAVQASTDAIQRGSKRRTRQITLLREATNNEISDAVGSWFPPEHRDEMIDAQMAWRAALLRPLREPERVEAALYAALVARGLQWQLRPFRTARAAWAAWAARAARDAWDALTIRFARRMGWQAGDDPEQYTLGILDAYTYGLAIALPTGLNELGWAMTP